MKGTILEKIIEAKRTRVEAAKRLSGLRTVQPLSQQFRLSQALSNSSGPHIIAEFKRASPSRGVINDSLKPEQAAASYCDGGAVAISVLTEEDFFQGSLDDLRSIREVVALPILRKDFIIDEFQIRESAAAGADAILLIVAALSIDELASFHSLANELGLDALVEVHSEKEMETAVAIGSNLIGVNNRDLLTFEVSLDVSRQLIKQAPPEATLISESGIKSRHDISELFDLGYSGFLIGETLMKAEDPGRSLDALI